jgi:transposase-like protein
MKCKTQCKNVIKAGIHTNKMGKYQKMHCKDCGSTFVGKLIEYFNQEE